MGEKEDEGQPPRSRRRSSASEEEDDDEVTPVDTADDTVEVPTGKSKPHNNLQHDRPAQSLCFVASFLSRSGLLC